MSEPRRILHVTAINVENFVYTLAPSESAKEVLDRWRQDGGVWVGSYFWPWHEIGLVRIEERA